ncbi:MAG: hypothetical protein GX799_11080 [Crenarchaeota archaeon]|jgi:hypothetical protein|nr:hypothetical protein [Thermoproteota archaeon]
MNKPKPRLHRLWRLLLFPFIVPLWLLGWILYYFGEGLRPTCCSEIAMKGKRPVNRVASSEACERFKHSVQRQGSEAQV